MCVYVVCMTDGDKNNICSTNVFSTYKKAFDYISNYMVRENKKTKSYKSINYRGAVVVHMLNKNKGMILYMDQDEFPISTKHFVIKSTTVK